MIEKHPCPWWLIRTFDNPLRRLLHDPDVILDGLVQPGQTAIDLGCGIGYFTIPLARQVGAAGTVIAVDLQERMLQGVRRRAEQAGVQARVRLHRCQPTQLGLEVAADFALAFWMVHEVSDPTGFLRQVRAAMRPTGRLLVVEPIVHVPAGAFRETVATATQAGWQPVGTRRVALSRAVLLAPQDADIVAKLDGIADTARAAHPATET